MTPTRFVPLLLLLASTTVVGGALLFQYVGGLPPCHLCLYQRWPYYITIGLTVLTLGLGRRDVAAWVAGLCALLFLAGGVLAFYHVGVEQHWFAGPSSCTGPQSAADSVEALTAQILGQKPVRCDEVAWSLFGVSLAGWNLLASLGLVVFCLAGWRRLGAWRAA